MGCLGKLIKLALTILISIVGIKIIIKLAGDIYNVVITISSVASIGIVTAIIFTVVLIAFYIGVIIFIWNFLSWLYHYLF